MQLVTVLILAVLISGCEVFHKFWEKEFVQKYAPETQRNRQKENFVQALNFYLEKPKSERVRIAGSPSTCTKQNSSEENCEWTWVSNSGGHTVVYTYGGGGLAKSWTYNGYFGQFTSANYAAVNSSVKPQTPADLPQQKAWTHPFKTDSQIEQDTLQCRTEVQMYPRAVWDPETDKCLKRNGWTQR